MVEVMVQVMVEVMVVPLCWSCFILNMNISRFFTTPSAILSFCVQEVAEGVRILIDFHLGNVLLYPQVLTFFSVTLPMANINIIVFINLNYGFCLFSKN